MFKGSWKTTTAAILGIISSAITLIALPLLDNDPNTSANFPAFIAAATLAAGLLFSRDNDKSSEDVGAK